MWETAKRLERIADSLQPHNIKKQRILTEVKKIKDAVQSVIGQME